MGDVGHFEAATAPYVMELDTTPRPEDCPLAGHAHDSQRLPWPRPEYHYLVVMPRGSLLVVVNGRFG